jgi:hypothetical protein
MIKPSPTQNHSLVSIEVGSVNTRAHFFDNVEGRFRFIATGEAPSTIGTPAFDLTYGVLEALEQLQDFTGRTFISDQNQLISGDTEDGSGANAITTTFSGGPPLKVITVGLLGEVSLASVNNLVRSSYCQIVESFGLNDRRRPEEIIDAICRNLPDLIVMAGGTNRGASRSIIRLANYLSLAIKLIPETHRPQVLFVGNEDLHEEIDNLLGALTKLHHSSNIRPNLDQESLNPARQALNAIYFEIQATKLNGLQEFRDLSDGQIQTSASAMGRVVRFLSTVIDARKGMLGVDLGASHTTVASAFAGDLQLCVLPQLGVGNGLPGMIAETHLAQIMRWLPFDITEDYVLDYLHNKPLHPGSLPTNLEDLAIEQAIARQVIRLAIGKNLSFFPKDAIYPIQGTIPWFDRIMVSGSSMARTPKLEQSLLMILDAIQPVGIATVILDQNNLASSIGASAELEPLMAVHILESNAFINLGTVISPVGNTQGKHNPILRIQIMYEGEKQGVMEVLEGDITCFRLPHGRIADIYVQPLQNANIGLGRGRGGWVRRVVGGVFGLIIDARGRPIKVPNQLSRRQEILNAWQQALALS